MSAPISAVESMNFGLPFWLPPFGRGNGLQALYWATIRCPAAGPHPIATGQRPAKGPSVYGWRR